MTHSVNCYWCSEKESWIYIPFHVTIFFGYRGRRHVLPNELKALVKNILELLSPPFPSFGIVEVWVMTGLDSVS